MRLVVLFNPIAGGGRAEAAARQIEQALHQAGHEAILVPTRPGGAVDELSGRIADCEVLVVIGGDGAVRAASVAAIRADKPLYHVPYGTANLFAREFGMTRDRRTLLDALTAFNVIRVDAAEANGVPFVLMASVGFDAEVACDLANRRGASISFLSYAGPMLRQLRQWRPPRLSVTVDGNRIISDGAGIVVVANCRRYAFGLNPARQADMTDGLLDVVFMPVRSRLDVLGWITRCALGRQMAARRLIFCRGATVGIEFETPQRFQIDGDPPDDGEAARTLSVSVRPGVLPVLLPTSGAATAKDR